MLANLNAPTFKFQWTAIDRHNYKCKAMLLKLTNDISDKILNPTHHKRHLTNEIVKLYKTDVKKATNALQNPNSEKRWVTIACLKSEIWKTKQKENIMSAHFFKIAHTTKHNVANVLKIVLPNKQRWKPKHLWKNDVNLNEHRKYQLKYQKPILNHKQWEQCNYRQ